MEAFKFETTVKENGVIQIPEIARLAHQQVEVFVVVRPTVQQKAGKLQAVENFLAKWRGLLKDFDPDELKFQYLQEKYK